MRIRSIKPDFWSSEDIADKDWETRLVFIGLWSYVDDNGVGRDNEKLIVADLFPLEDDPRETLAKVSRALSTLSAGGQITRYTVDRKRYLFITEWDKHQKIDKPGKPRHPRPTCGDAEFEGPSRDSRETPGPGAVEQGNRGEEEQGRSDGADAPPHAPPVPADETEGQRVNRLARTYTDRVRLSNFNAVRGVVLKAVRESDRAGRPKYGDQQIVDALSRLIDENRGVSADALRIALEGPPSRPPRQSSREAGYSDAMSIAEELRQRELQDQLAIEGGAA